MTYHLHSFGFTVRVPSQTYLNRTQGLCGNCNDDPKDDMRRSDGSLVTDPDHFGASWLTKRPLDGASNERHCRPHPDRPKCKPMEPAKDPCRKLIDGQVFRQCHALVDPLPYVAACQADLCGKADPQGAACRSFEAYARQCATVQVCLPWRSEDLCPARCPPGMEHRQCGTGCLNDCSLHQQQADRGTAACLMSPADGCYCPEDEAFNRMLGRCVPVEQCLHCDSDGHLPGDSWDVDVCTNCTCLVNSGQVLCQKDNCVLDQCALGLRRQVVDPKPGQCCPTVVCLPPESLNIRKITCPANTSAPQCGKDQTLTYQEVSGCLRQVCECIPAADCPRLTPPAPQPGQRYEVNESGCCPYIETICVPDKCPSKPDCPPYYVAQLDTATTSNNSCCPRYVCSTPKDVCIYEHREYEIPPGPAELRQATTAKPEGIKSIKGKKRSVSHPPTLTIRRYQINATWTDGPCLHCVCEYDVTTKTTQSVCTAQQCPDPSDDDYVIQQIPVKGECCPKLFRSACQLESRVYRAGETWPSPGGDPCKSYRCAQQPDGSVVKQLAVAECKVQCPPGWRYRPANHSVPGQEGKCCGDCAQVACAAKDGTEHKLGREWKSDPCTTSVCVERNNAVRIDPFRTDSVRF